jgi:hypothetical protein
MGYLRSELVLCSSRVDWLLKTKIDFYAAFCHLLPRMIPIGQRALSGTSIWSGKPSISKVFVNTCWQTAEMAQLTQVPGEVPRVAAHWPHRFYQPELDGLRFYAFLGVFVFHTLPGQAVFYRGLHLPLPWLWGAVAKSGGAGVDLFFALSAFLITSILLRERQTACGISLRLFYIRRILRIWPLYFAVISLGHCARAHRGKPESSLVLRCRLRALRR